jgi:hypothetical protein
VRDESMDFIGNPAFVEPMKVSAVCGQNAPRIFSQIPVDGGIVALDQLAALANERIGTCFRLRLNAGIGEVPGYIPEDGASGV